MKYLVMECHLSYAVVLDENGQFRKAANRNYEVGQTVTDIVEMQLPQKKKTAPWLRSLTAVAACLVLAVTGIFAMGRLPYASVYMTINPQVRIDVSRTDRVVAVEGVNEDGRALLENYEFREKDLDLVMDELVDRAIDMGYLHEGGKVTLTLDADDQWVGSHKQALSEKLNHHLTQRITVTIDVEEKQTGTPVPTATAGQSVDIPVDRDSGGQSDYGESDYGDEEPEEKETAGDEGDSGYDSPGDEGMTDYGLPEKEEASPYDDREEESPYDEPEPEEELSPYDDRDEGESPYEDPEGDSEYEDPEEEEKDD